jgi:peptidoglycan/LPS O-acetylase OafA/YrhL
LGCLVAFLLDKPAAFRLTYPLVGRVWSAPLAAAMLGLALTIDETPLTLIFLAMAYLVATCCVRPDHWLRAPLANPVVRYVGTVSYGMYLLHMIANKAALRIAPGLSAAAIAGLTVLISIGLASLSYHFYERRFLKLKERFEIRTHLAHSPSVVIQPDHAVAK